MEKEESLQQIVLDKWTSPSKRMKLEPYLTPCAKINSEWTNALNVRTS
jgi:hypothetical protein